MSFFEDFTLNEEQSFKAKSLFSKRKMNDLWKYIDSLKLPLPKSSETELICGHKNTFIRAWKSNKYDSRPKN